MSNLEILNNLSEASLNTEQNHVVITGDKTRPSASENQCKLCTRQTKAIELLSDLEGEAQGQIWPHQKIPSQ